MDHSARSSKSYQAGRPRSPRLGTSKKVTGGMKEFVFKRGTAVRLSGETLWHVYALPELRKDAALASLVAV